jgi:hypothetical protein
MDIIVTGKSFNKDNIMIKYSKINQKIIYNIDKITILGIPLKLNTYTILNDTEKTLIIKINDNNDLILLKKINKFFFLKYGKNYKSFIKDNTLKIRKNDLNLIDNNENIYISINNIKKKGNYYTINTFII